MNLWGKERRKEGVTKAWKKEDTEETPERGQTLESEEEGRGEIDGLGPRGTRISLFLNL